ncbi:hypothetical protein J4421_02045 [Candidatus Woesearchaeota archaeon]|nr:hypothetical protein [Candidatus Woesearchaeota archaeon]
MSSSPSFEWLVRFHFEHNVAPNLSSFRNGQLCDSRGKPLKEGKDTNSPTFGYLILENGDTLVSRLHDEDIILDLEPPQFHPTPTYDAFIAFLKAHEDEDGAFFSAAQHSTTAKISTYNNQASALKADRLRSLTLIPPDFVFFDQKHPVTAQQYDLHVGTKTDLAIRLPYLYSRRLDCDVHAYQIKRSPYGTVGLGKVTDFGAQGLEKEFFFHHNPEHQGPFLVPDQMIYGVVRGYKMGEEGRVVRTGQRIITSLDEL